MNYINLTNTNGRDIIINVDRIDCILSDADRCKIYVGGSDYPIYVSNKINEILDMFNENIAIKKG